MLQVWVWRALALPLSGCLSHKLPCQLRSTNSLVSRCLWDRFCLCKSDFIQIFIEVVYISNDQHHVHFHTQQMNTGQNAKRCWKCLNLYNDNVDHVQLSLHQYSIILSMTEALDRFIAELIWGVQSERQTLLKVTEHRTPSKRLTDGHIIEDSFSDHHQYMSLEVGQRSLEYLGVLSLARLRWQ
jgi:hypothetical protein